MAADPHSGVQARNAAMLGEPTATEQSPTAAGWPPGLAPSAGSELDVEGLPSHLTDASTLVPAPDEGSLDLSVAAPPKSEDRVDDPEPEDDEIDLSVVGSWYDLIEQEDEQLQLAAKTIAQGQRDKWAKKGIAMRDGSFPIPNTDYLKRAIKAIGRAGAGKRQAVMAHIKKHAKRLGATKLLPDHWTSGQVNAAQDGEPTKLKCPKCDYMNLASAKKCKNCGHDLTDARKAKFANMSEDQPHQAVLYQQRDGMQLAVEKGDLVQKVICTSGSLALSPGPGQVDVEKPLHLTSELFGQIKQAFDEQAFPYVTVPETHANGSLENTGYVRELSMHDKNDPKLPESIREAYKDAKDDTKLLMAGIEFTEPEVREKAKRGSIADTSIGVKFNYRNKRTGKLYPAALEHVALTNVPWVDGLVPFGLSQEGTVVDADAASVPYDGVFVDAPESEEPSGDGGDGSGAKPDDQDTDLEHGDTLPSREQDETILGMDGDDTPTTVEEILAAQQVAAEQQATRIRDLEQKLELAQGVISSQGEQLHKENVAKRVKQLEGKLPPSVLLAAESVWLADKSAIADDGDGLNLSVQTQKTDGDGLEERTLKRPSEIVDFLLSQIPTDDQAVVILAQARSGLADLATENHNEAQKADKQVEEWEKKEHPERFDAEGKRK